MSLEETLERIAVALERIAGKKSEPVEVAGSVIHVDLAAADAAAMREKIESRKTVNTVDMNEPSPEKKVTKRKRKKKKVEAVVEEVQEMGTDEEPEEEVVQAVGEVTRDELEDALRTNVSITTGPDWALNLLGEYGYKSFKEITAENVEPIYNRLVEKNNE